VGRLKYRVVEPLHLQRVAVACEHDVPAFAGLLLIRTVRVFVQLDRNIASIRDSEPLFVYVIEVVLIKLDRIDE